MELFDILTRSARLVLQVLSKYLTSVFILLGFWPQQQSKSVSANRIDDNNRLFLKGKQA